MTWGDAPVVRTDLTTRQRLSLVSLHEVLRHPSPLEYRKARVESATTTPWWAASLNQRTASLSSCARVCSNCRATVRACTRCGSGNSLRLLDLGEGSSA